jgi:hypothetical protein
MLSSSTTQVSSEEALLLHKTSNEPLKKFSSHRRSATFSFPTLQDECKNQEAKVIKKFSDQFNEIFVGIIGEVLYDQNTNKAQSDEAILQSCFEVSAATEGNFTKLYNQTVENNTECFRDLYTYSQEIYSVAATLASSEKLPNLLGNILRERSAESLQKINYSELFEVVKKAISEFYPNLEMPIQNISYKIMIVICTSCIIQAAKFIALIKPILQRTILTAQSAHDEASESQRKQQLTYINDYQVQVKNFLGKFAAAITILKSIFDKQPFSRNNREKTLLLQLKTSLHYLSCYNWSTNSQFAVGKKPGTIKDILDSIFGHFTTLYESDSPPKFYTDKNKNSQLIYKSIYKIVNDLLAKQSLRHEIAVVAYDILDTGKLPLICDGACIDSYNVYEIKQHFASVICEHARLQTLDCGNYKQHIYYQIMLAMCLDYISSLDKLKNFSLSYCENELTKMLEMLQANLVFQMMPEFYFSKQKSKKINIAVYSSLLVFLGLLCVNFLVAHLYNLALPVTTGLFVSLGLSLGVLEIILAAYVIAQVYTTFKQYQVTDMTTVQFFSKALCLTLPHLLIGIVSVFGFLEFQSNFNILFSTTILNPIACLAILGAVAIFNIILFYKEFRHYEHNPSNKTRAEVLKIGANLSIVLGLMIMVGVAVLLTNPLGWIGGIFAILGGCYRLYHAITANNVLQQFPAPSQKVPQEKVGEEALISVAPKKTHTKSLHKVKGHEINSRSLEEIGSHHVFSASTGNTKGNSSELSFAEIVSKERAKLFGNKNTSKTTGASATPLSESKQSAIVVGSSRAKIETCCGGLNC